MSTRQKEKNIRTGLICFSFVTILLSYSMAWSQNIPSLNSIVRNVVKAAIPAESYNVSVVQSISAPSGTVVAQAMSKGTLSSQTTFTVTYNPASGLSTKKISKAPQKTPLSRSNQITITQPADVRITMDLSKLAQKVTTWQNVQISSDKLAGRGHWKISGQDGATDYILWVDSVNNYISKIILNIKGQKFSESTINYRYVNNKYWLPSTIVIDHASDGSRVTQNFGTYNIISKP